MKLLAISDTHSNLHYARMIIERLKDRIDAVAHLGDMYDDARRLEEEFSGLPFHYVAGNCDTYFNTYDAQSQCRVIELGGKKIMLAHGHDHGIKFDYFRFAQSAIDMGANAAICGHTHVPYVAYVYDALILNPGSISQPRGRKRLPTYGILNIDEDGKLDASVMAITIDNQIIPYREY